MTFSSLPLWQIVLGGIQIFLSCLILVLLIHHHFRQKSKRLPMDDQSSGAGFEKEFFRQTFRQQSERAFEMILKAIQKEREAMAQILRTDPSDFSADRQAPQPEGAFQNRNPDDSGQDVAADEIVNVLYAEAKELAEAGMSPGDIAANLKIPRAEIDLLLKLNSGGFKSDENASGPAA